MNNDDLTKDDEIVTVQLPYKDYKIMREIIDERQAMKGLGKILEKLFWVAGGILGLLGIIAFLKGYAN